MLYDLENCFGGVVDTVIYGEVLNESDPWVDDLGNIPSVLTPKPKSGQSLGRVPDGFDSDIGSDFHCWTLFLRGSQMIYSRHVLVLIL